MQLSPSDPDVQTIVSRIRSGDLDLQPDFQRGEVWSLQKKRRLIDSILRNWHVPPLHTVIANDTGKQEVLDGQQRLVSIRDFAQNEFTVDGSIEPFDELIFSLNGLFYKDLPDWARRRFDQFTIRVFRITDYHPDEPGELFYRLNRITNLTAAEQRNAFFGPVRQQVKDLVSYFLRCTDAQEVYGFSNSRMAYDDVVAKLLATLEHGSLNIKITAGTLSDRYRSKKEIEPRTYELAQSTLDHFRRIACHSERSVRFNRATMLTWLLFFARILDRSCIQEEDQQTYSSYVLWFESFRGRFHSTAGFDLVGRIDLSSEEFGLFNIFNDRSTARVADVSSVIYRDFIAFYFAERYFEVAGGKLRLAPAQAQIIRAMKETLSSPSDGDPEGVLESGLDFRVWGNLR